MHTLRVVLSIPLTSLICLVTSNLVSWFFLRQKDGFGLNELLVFLDWTRLFAIALLLPAVAFTFLMFNARLINRIWVGVLLGGAAGFGWMLLSRAMLGPWIGAWTFNFLSCWIAGGATGILAAALLGYSRRALP